MKCKGVTKSGFPCGNTAGAKGFCERHAEQRALVPAVTAPNPVVYHRDSGAIINPASGELVTPDATSAALAECREAIVELEVELKDAKRAIDDVITARMDRAALWTIRAGGYKLSAPSPVRVKEEWDDAGLRSFLERQVADGVIDQAAADAAVKYGEAPLVRSKRGINALLKIMAIREDVLSYRTLLDPPARYVRVERA